MGTSQWSEYFDWQLKITEKEWRCVFYEPYYENQKNFECSFRVIGPHCDMIPDDCTMQGRQIWQTDRQQSWHTLGSKSLWRRILFFFLWFEDIIFLILTSLETLGSKPLWRCISSFILLWFEDKNFLILTSLESCSHHLELLE